MNKTLKILVWPVILIPAAYLAITWSQIPALVPMHFNLQGQPDRIGSKRELLSLTAIMASVNILIFLLLSNAHRIDPRKSAADNKDRLLRIAFAVAAFMSAILIMIIYNTKAGYFKLGIPLILSSLGLLFAIMGNYMPNMKPNYFAGLRLPWTLESEDNWRRTHALAGRLWFGGGLLLALICLFVPTTAAIVLFFIILTFIILIPCIYSYRYYRLHKLKK